MFGTGNALIRFYYRVNPEELSEKDWAIAVSDIRWVLKLQQEMLRRTIWGDEKK